MQWTPILRMWSAVSGTDQRLMSVLGAANSVFRSVLQPNRSPTYGASGQVVSAKHPIRTLHIGGLDLRLPRTAWT